MDFSQITTKAIANKSVWRDTAGKRAIGRILSLTAQYDLDKVARELVQSELMGDLTADIFWNLFDVHPTFQEKVLPEREISKMIIDWLEQTPRWDSVKIGTNANIVGSALTAELLATNILNNPDIVEALKKQLEQEQQQEQQGGQGGGSSPEPQQQGGDVGQPNDETQDGQGNDQGESPDENMRKIAQELASKLSSNANKARRAQTIQKSADQAKETAESLAAWGYGKEAGATQMTDASEIIKKIKTHGHIAARLSKMVGRLQGIALNTRAKVVARGGHLVVRDGYTQKIQNTLIGERALVRPEVNPLIRATKIAEYADHGLLGYQEGHEARERGGLVIGVDTSGSMDGERNFTAKALAIATNNAARDNNQDCKMFLFGSTGETKDYPEGVAEQIEWASYMFGGGTCFDTAIQKAVRIINGLPEEKRCESDIVLITDGEARIGDNKTHRDLLDVRRKYGTRVIWFQVREGRLGDLENYVDGIVNLANLDEVNIDEAVEQLNAMLESRQLRENVDNLLEKSIGG